MAQIGDVYNIPNTTPFEKATEFDNEYLDKIYASLTGRKYELGEVPKEWTDQVKPDGTVVRLVTKTEPKWMLVEDKEVARIMNDKGAKFLCRQLKYIYNRPAAMGEMVNDEIVNTAANTVERAFIHLILNDIEYGVQDGDALLTEMNSILAGVHLYLSSLKNGGLKKWSGGFLGESHMESRDQGAEQSVLSISGRKVI
jgi:hypothetical protein